MQRIGRITTWLGIILTTVGLIAGFGLIWLGHHQTAKSFLMMTPIGFLLLLTGVVTAFLSDDTDKPREPE
ncbi:MAG TPA: hypothetical protein EYH06_07970 [Chromatiales bacterium]|nr:hypothetical protein [Chromatiales bacterium]